MAMATRPACATSELIAKARESAVTVLQALLGRQPAAASKMPHGIQDLIEQILRCCDRALAALQGAAKDAAGPESARKRTPERGPDVPEMTSSKRMRGSSGERGIRVEKKWTMEDGYIWRKYGQKEIRDSKYPRLYFRCSYREDSGCKARRRVQQSDADPSIYLISYFGEHTCGRERDNDEPPAPFVINFSSSCTRDGQPGGSPWLSRDDDLLVVGETSGNCGLSEGEETPADTTSTSKVAELIKQSTPVPGLVGMRSPVWEPLDYGCLDWELGEDEEWSFDFGEFSNLDYLALLQ